MNVNEPARPYSRDEFLLASQVAEPQELDNWLPRVSAMLLTISTNPEVFGENPDEMVHAIQQFATQMPVDLLLIGTLTMVNARQRAEELLDE